MKSSISLILPLCLLFPTLACTTYSFDAFRGTCSIQMDNQSKREYTVKRKFQIEDKAGWFIGLIPVNEPAGGDEDYLIDLVAYEVRKTFDLDHSRAGVMNLEIEVKNDVVDYLLWLFPWYETETVVITGEVVEFDEPQTADLRGMSDPPLLATRSTHSRDDTSKRTQDPE